MNNTPIIDHHAKKNPPALIPDNQQEVFLAACNLRKITNAQHAQTGTLAYSPEERIIGETYHDETPAEKIKIDNLFMCVAELKRNLDRLTYTGITKLISVHRLNTPVWISVQRVVLPSGKSIFLGYLDQHMLVSDGEIYYIDALVTEPQGRVWPPLIYLIVHLLHAGNHYITRPAAANTLTMPMISRYRPTPTQSKGINPAMPNSMTGWLSKIGEWLGTFHDPLIFPQTAALHSDDSDEDEEIALANSTTCEPASTLNPIIDKSPCGTKGLSGRITFSSNGMTRTLYLANEDARNLLDNLRDEFFRDRGIDTHPLDYLIDFDKFIGIKIFEIFHRGLYLNKMSHSIDIIIIKKYLERFINEFSENILLPSEETYKIRTYLKQQIKIKNHLTHFHTLLVMAYSAIDDNVITDAIEARRNTSIEDARDNILKKIIDATIEEKPYWNKVLSTLSVLASAHKEYCGSLTPDVDSTLSRELYKNNKEIIKSIITGNEHELIENLEKLKFYYIFEYTRLNGISIQSSNFLMPGELTESITMFDDTNDHIDLINTEQLFTEELISYISHDNKHPNLNRLLKIIELSKHEDNKTEYTMSWHDKNMHHIHIANLICSKLTSSNKYELQKNHKATDWTRDIQRNMRDTKILYAFSVYMIKFQKAFNLHILFFIDNKITLDTATEEQRVCAAKIEAYRRSYPDLDTNIDDFELLGKYDDKFRSGDVQLLLRAAAYWYTSNPQNTLNHVLVNQNVVYVVERFLTMQMIISHHLQLRYDSIFTSIFDLTPSENHTSLENYYQQFITYKMKYSLLEAKKICSQTLSSSVINYIDIIYPAKSALHFQVYSRNFVSNSLAPNSIISHPHKNIGYLSFYITRNGQLIFHSTVSGLSFTTNISILQKSQFIDNLTKSWHSGISVDNEKLRPHVPVNINDITNLLNLNNTSGEDITNIIDILFKAPEACPVLMDEPEYTFVAVSDDEIHQIVKKYRIHSIDEDFHLNVHRPLLHSMDMLIQATLIAIADEFKESLRTYSWPEHIAGLIPFFTTFSRNWHDQEYDIKFSDIIFDLTDLIISLLSALGKVGNLSSATLHQAFKKASLQRIPPHMLRKFLTQELAVSAQKFVLSSSLILSKELASFLNPFPLPKGLFTLLIHNASNSVQKSMSIFNNIILHNVINKKESRKPWIATVDRHALQSNDKNMYSLETNQGMKYYIKRDDEFFRVVKDYAPDQWRIIRAGSDISFHMAVPIMRTVAGKWISNHFFQLSNDVSFFNSYMTYQGPSAVLDEIKFEPEAAWGSPDSLSADTSRLYQKTLQFYFDNNHKIRGILQNDGRHLIPAEASYASFFFNKDILTLTSCGTDMQHSNACNDILDLTAKAHLPQIQFRMLIAWKSLDKILPVSYLALTVKIKEYTFIIDLVENKKKLAIFDTREIFLEQDWISTHQSNIDSEFVIVKYKDFHSFNDARLFFLQEKHHPVDYIEDGFLLKYPFWYKSTAIHEFDAQQKLRYSGHYRLKTSYRTAVRYSKKRVDAFPFKEEFPLHILYSCGKLTKEAKFALSGLIKSSKTVLLEAQSILIGKHRVMSTSELLSINEGKLVAFYQLDGFLVHLLLSLGNGKFAGIENSMFDSSVPNRASIILAEHLGNFHNGLLVRRKNVNPSGQGLVVIAGTALGAKELSTTMLTRPPQKSIPAYSPDGVLQQYQETKTTRLESLLGKDCAIELIGNLKNRIRLKVHGSHFNANNMDAIELADVIRGLTFATNMKFDISALVSIELFSCYGGYGGRFSLAQILADELNVPVKAYPSVISIEIQKRRPEWYRYYLPTANEKTSETNIEDYLLDNKQFNLAQSVHQRLHDLMNLIRKTLQANTGVRRKREFTHIPFIFLDILHTLVPDNQYPPVDINSFVLTEHSRLLLSDIVGEYGPLTPEQSDAVEQAFLDIILSVPEFRYLLNFLDDSELGITS